MTAMEVHEGSKALVASINRATRQAKITDHVTGTDHLTGIEKFEAELWKIADNLRANSNLASNEYFMPIMGLIFLRHATNRFYEAKAAIEADKAAGKMPDRPLVEADFTRRRALILPEEARFDVILKTPKDGNLGAASTAPWRRSRQPSRRWRANCRRTTGASRAMCSNSMMRMFDSEGLRTASGDVFGRIYEYFLAEFSKQGAHDDGEFFTPPSIVQTIVNVIEPDHGIVFDPACGSGGMFVQSSHFIEDAGQDTMKRVTFYGHEKNETTAKLAQINLAVHGLQGTIRAGNEAITYYKDPHELVGKCDFVMANPPFNVDEVDAEKVKGDKRLPFGLPGVNKAKKVSNANYLWMSYFYSYLNENGPRGRGHVLAGVQRRARRGDRAPEDRRDRRGRCDDRYPRQLLLHPHRAVPALVLRPREGEGRGAARPGADARRAQHLPQGLALGLRFHPGAAEEHRRHRLALSRAAGAVPELVAVLSGAGVADGRDGAAAAGGFEEALGKLADLIEPFAKAEREHDPLAEPWDELTSAQATLAADIEAFAAEAAAQAKQLDKAAPRQCRAECGAGGAASAGGPLPGSDQADRPRREAGGPRDRHRVKELEARDSDAWNNAEVKRARKALEEARAAAVEALRQRAIFRETGRLACRSASPTRCCAMSRGW